MSQHANPVGPSSQPSASRQPHVFGQPSGDTTFDKSVTDEAQGYVESYRRGTIARNKAEAAIGVVIQRGADDAGIPYSSDLSQPYIDQLDAQDKVISEAEVEGETQNFNSFPVVTPEPSRTKKRRRDDEESSSSSDSESDEETPRRRRKRIDRSKLAWQVDSDSTELRESVKLVVGQLENFSQDPKEALRLLRTSGTAPTFPTQSWKEVLEGSFIDFDHVNKDLFGGGTVSSEEDWGRVWRVVERAITFAFTKRGNELQTYGTYIFDFFQQFKSDHHANVINFDKAVRHFVTNSRGVLFSDTNRFTHLEKSYLSPGGRNYIEPLLTRGPKRGSNNRNRSADEICRNWNNGNCSKGAEPCPGGRKHVCTSCGASDHRRKDKKQCTKSA